MRRPTGQPSAHHFLCNSDMPGPFPSSALFHRGTLARHLWSEVLLCLLSHLIIIAILGHRHYSLVTGEPAEAQRDGAICLKSGSSQVASPRGSGARAWFQHPPTEAAGKKDLHGSTGLRGQACQALKVQDVCSLSGWTKWGNLSGSFSYS